MLNWISLLFCSYALGHSHMILPMPLFTNSPGDENNSVVTHYESVTFPTFSLVNLNGAPAVFQDYMAKAGLKTLREFADKYGQKCGNTDPSHVTAIPDHFERVIGIDHIGGLEIWMDDVRLFPNSGIADDYKDTTSIQVDFSSCKGSCVVRYIMVALHVPNPEIFDNCVTIQVESSAGSNADSNIPVKNQLPNSETMKPTPVNGVQAPANSCTVNEVKCQGSGLATCTNGGGATTIWLTQACPLGTTCKTTEQSVACA